jgi:predicted nucleic acid-binding protein
MMFILDTKAASDPIKPKPNVHFARWLAAADPETIFLPVTAVAEMEYGVALARRLGHPQISALERDVVRVVRAAQILDLDHDTALLLGRMWAVPALRSFMTSEPGARKVQHGSDLQIAAIALRHDAILVTRNTRDFQRIGEHFAPIRLHDPFASAPH